MKAIKITTLLIIVLFLGAKAQDTILSSKDYLDLGNKLLKKKKYELAIENFTKSIELNVEEVEAYTYRGLAYYKLNKCNEAIKDFDIALLLKDGYAEAYNFRGLAKGELGDQKGACEDWYQAYYHGLSNAYRLINKFCKDYDEKELKKSK
ncbi:MAG: tetratricopeptide repeat protein [Saprospiraceae bacterium]|nr:tetratricopeptide repeat protein [Saprospiraceae bacterium]